MNGLMVGVGGVTVVVLVPFVMELLHSTKLAHVKRVVLELWTTSERLPKKEPRPAAEDTYRSVYLRMHGRSQPLRT